MNKKIIGYKALKDLPDVDKGTIGVAKEDASEGMDYEFPSNNRTMDDGNLSYYSKLAVEGNTEFFEPIYEQELKPIKIAGHIMKVEDGKIHVGCQSYSEAELRAYRKLLAMGGQWHLRDRREIQLMVLDLEITVEMIDQALEMLGFNLKVKQ